MNLQRLALLTGSVLCLAISLAHATDIRHWKRDPIAIDLPVGTERIVVIGDPVRVGLPPQLAQPQTLRVQSTNGAIYLKALKPFDTQRVQIQDMTTGQIILVDLTGKKQASHETVQVAIDTPDRPAGTTGSDTASSEPDPSDAIPPEAFGRSSHGAPSPVRLVRHAAQALYAPQRLIGTASGVRRIALSTRHALPGLLPSYPVTVRPVAAWRAGAYTVTAIEVTNRDPKRTFELDPRDLAGDFYAASFMYDRIGPAGTLDDTTTLFAVTENGDLSDALTPPAGDAAIEDTDAD